MAATFVNTEIGRSFRIVSTERARELVSRYAPDEVNPRQAQLEAYKRMPLHELFEVQEVRVDIPENDYPGPTRAKAVCSKCGAVIRDGREIRNESGALCHYCAGQAYYKYPLDVDIRHLDNQEPERQVGL